MISKVGRPFSDNPKDIRLTIRLDKEHSVILEAFAKRNNISRNEAIRRAIKRLEDQDD